MRDDAWDRRRFLRAGLAAGGGAACLPLFARQVLAQEPGRSPYGPIEGRVPDANGLVLPEGFTSRIVAVSGDPVDGTPFRWPAFPDGAATFPDDDGGWYYVCNSEVRIPGRGGASAIHFSADGEVMDAYSVLEGSIANCAGGPTPWGTWLSCEEDAASPGLVWECDPTGAAAAVAHPRLGRYAHEAVAVDPTNRQLYLTEDEPDGLLYRFTPTAYPDLSAGRLDAATVADDGAVRWTEVPDPEASSGPTRSQVPDATKFPGGEGIWHHDGVVYFTTKGDDVVHALDLASQVHSEVYRAVPDDVAAGTSPLYGVDNITVDTDTGELFVAEDGGQMRVVIIGADGTAAPFLQVVGHEGSEVTGPVFSPDRTRLYFSSQRGPSSVTVGEAIGGLAIPTRNAGITYEVRGPFRTTADTEVAATTSGSGEGDAANEESDDPSGAVIGLGAAAAVAAGVAVIARRRRDAPPH